MLPIKTTKAKHCNVVTFMVLLVFVPALFGVCSFVLSILMGFPAAGSSAGSVAVMYGTLLLAPIAGIGLTLSLRRERSSGRGPAASTTLLGAGIAISGSVGVGLTLHLRIGSAPVPMLLFTVFHIVAAGIAWLVAIRFASRAALTSSR